MRNASRRLVLRLIAATFLLLAVGLVGPAAERPVDGYGVLSLVPAATAIALAFLTREVLLALFVAVALGGVITGQLNVLKSFFIPAIGSPQYALILLVYLWSLGGLIGIWTRTGGAQAFAEWAGGWLVRGRRSAKLFAWFVGLVFHQGGTISTVLAGTTVRPVSDREGVSHEELSYVVDSTASPVAGIIPLNVWPVYVAGLVAGTIPLLPDQDAAITFFYRSIPVNFYGIFAVSLTWLFALEWMPWAGKRMGQAMQRVRRTGQLDAPGATPLTALELTELKKPDDYSASPIDFAIPILTLIGFALGSYFVTGSVMIGEAFGLAVLAAAMLAWIRGLRVGNIIDGFVDGCKGVTTGAILLGLAVTLSQVSAELGTAGYIVEAVSAWLIPSIFPALVLGICMVVSFSIGTSFGTFAVIFPLVLPLAWSLSSDPDYISLCFASVIGGSMFGDQCSPISDTTILSSLACGADLMDHVRTQLPLAFVAAVLAAVAYTVGALVVLY